MAIEQLERLAVGDFFTINRWTSGTDHSWCGDVLKAVVVESPFVLFVQRDTDQPWPLDSRLCELQKLSPEYASLGWLRRHGVKPQSSDAVARPDGVSTE